MRHITVNVTIVLILVGTCGVGNCDSASELDKCTHPIYRWHFSMQRACSIELTSATATHQLAHLPSALGQADSVDFAALGEISTQVNSSPSTALRSPFQQRIHPPPPAIEATDRSWYATVSNAFSPVLETHPGLLLTLIGGALISIFAATRVTEVVFRFRIIPMPVKEQQVAAKRAQSSEMENRTRERKIEAEMRTALERSEFVLHYQPQVNLRTGKVVAAEALIRWNHPQRGLISPASFIDIAEKSGLIVPIGAWVLRTACAQAMAWSRMSLGDMRIAVNLSPHQFERQNFAEQIAAALQETGLPASRLDIELTESAMIGDVPHVTDVLQALCQLGVQISLDDFGTGYSSLSYIKRFPVNIIKIDRSFIHGILVDAVDAAITDAIISLAHNLEIMVIAEGVETEDQCTFLSRSMCDEIQGFFFSKPLPPEGMEALLREGKCLPNHLLQLHAST
jgi:EAL domain-containing protein (putative c-di-GMP-specific phosphodiesterase class I)